ncbi:flagellar brake domain-containing protein [Lysinibacillus fusiformis]|uniref:flagellar brake domain-containing protein n=1 Tax=Lysinibacillus fusiformis TaxID=28031 RepID=UPI0018808464|nr:flagellar brake domain-containing protein [Lysinibacillus fusiformis]MBD8523798.1 flagellar brake domain-containing protein [Lysinibacillus fusiformis]
MKNSIFSTGDTLHIEILNSQGELEQRLFSKVINQDQTSLLIQVPVCVQLKTNIYLQPNTTFIVHFEAANKTVYMFKSVVLSYTYEGPLQFPCIRVKKPRKRWIFTINRTGLKVKTNLNGYISQVHLTERIPVEITSLSTRCTAIFRISIAEFDLLNLKEEINIYIDPFCGSVISMPSLKSSITEDTSISSIKTNILKVDKFNPQNRNVTVKLHINEHLQKSLDNYCYDLVDKYLFESQLF